MNVPHLRLVPMVDAAHDRPRRRFSAWAPFPIAALAAVASIAGGLWLDLVAAGGLCAAGALAIRGSRRARLAVAALLLYAGYAFAIHAVAMPFDALFLAHCATLGASAFALVDLGIALHDERAWAWFDDRAPHRIAAGGLLAATGVLGALWIARAAPSLVATGDAAATVHVLDIALLLPALAVVAVNVLRGSAQARLHAAALLGLTGAMAAVIAGSLAAAAAVAPAITLGAVAVASIAMLAALLAHVRR